MASAGESQLQRIIRDLHDAVTELAKEYTESGEPITDDSTNLHKFSYKLEYLLQFDQKDKTTFLGTRKDYWDYFNDCLAKIKGANDGVRFVKSITELKTSLGRGRAFIRYSLVHQRLADTLQQCLINQKVTSDWYYSRSPFLKPQLSADIINYLYELNEVQFDVASRGHDLDSAWPTFARRTLGMTSSPSHVWKPPSRSSSINSLASSYSQVQEFLYSPDFGQGLLNESEEPLPDTSLNAMDQLRLELDQSELKQRELLGQVQQLVGEATELRGVVTELQRQLDVSLAAQANHQELQLKLQALDQRERTVAQELELLRAREAVREAENRELHGKLATAERKNEELVAKLDGVLEEKGQRATSHLDSAQKIHELLDGLKEAQRGRLEALADGEEKRKNAERLAEDLRKAKHDLRDGQAQITGLTEKSEKLMKRAEDQRSAMDKLQEELLVREKEANNLRKDLQDLQRCLEKTESEAAVQKKRTVKESEELQKNISALKEDLEGQVKSLKAELQTKEAAALSSAQRTQHLETEVQSAGQEKQTLRRDVQELETRIGEQSKKIDEYKEQFTNLMEFNTKLLDSAKKNEETCKNLVGIKAALESELAGLRASENQLRGQLDDAKVTVGEKEQRMREENRSLYEKLQKANMQIKESEGIAEKLHQENREFKEEHVNLKDSVASKQEEIRNIQEQVACLEKSLVGSRQNEANLTLQLTERDSHLAAQGKQSEKLLQTIDALEAQGRELQKGKVDAESALERQGKMIENLEVQRRAVEKAQLETSTCHAEESQQASLRIALLEEQLDLSVKQVSEIQGEVVDLKSKLRIASEDKAKIQGSLEITEASKKELQTLTEQLKKQGEELNRAHVSELLHSKQLMEAVTSELDDERVALSKLSADYATAQEQITDLKEQSDKLVLENVDDKDGLRRVNTEMAELGLTVCRLTAERQEAREFWEAEAKRVKDHEEQCKRETDGLNASLAALQQESSSLREELQQLENLPKTVLELKEVLDKAECEREAAREETAAVRFQMSSESMAHQSQVKRLNDELEHLRAELKAENETRSCLESKVSELEKVNTECSQLMVEKDLHITKAETLISSGEEEIQQLKDRLKGTQQALGAAQQESDELKVKLEKVLSDTQTQQVRMAAEIEDLSHTRRTLEERLIELIRDKDALWQKTDALEFEQKLRAEEQWWLVDKEATHCLSCQSQFTWRLRKHHCRLCGRIFCYYCSNNYVTTKFGVKKERCCRECYSQHSAVAERFSNSTNATAIAPHTASTPPSSHKPTPGVTVSDPNVKDDGVFDIITDEEVNELYDSDRVSQTTAESQEGETDDTKDLAVSGDLSAEGNESPPMVQDTEINLLKSEELSSLIELHIDDLCGFGDSPRELFVKSSCYSLVSVAVENHAPTIGWVFSSEPKSISFSVVYRESSDTPVDQSKVLIALTRCNAHRETMHGQLKARNPGIYTLIFDNSFSRFISKKINYHLTTEKPVIYDGSDCP